jgi:hypothetical protein
MDLAKRDILVENLKTLKKEKEQFLNERSRQLKKQQKDNPHLSSVVADYDAYFAGINSEKKKQSNALQVLVDYLNQIMLDPLATDEMIKQAKYDQQIILAELKKSFL